MSAADQVVLVLGMHRSGTSCLAGSLQQAGLELGDVFTSNPFNKKGNREHRDVMELNNDVLAHSGGAWDRAPTALLWTDEHAQRRDRFFAELDQRSQRGSARSTVGFKDPRALLTLPFWREAGRPLRFVGTYRHPAAVARSLLSRDRMPLDACLRLWTAYNERLLALHQEEPFPMVSFDAPADAYEAQVHGAIAALALDADAADFFDQALRRSVSAELAAQPLPADVVALYDALQAISCRS